MIEVIAGIGAVVVLILVLFRPQLGILAMVAWYPLENEVPRLPLPGLNAETILFGIVAALTLMRFGPRVPPLRYTGPILGFVLMLFVGFALTASGETFMIDFGRWEAFKTVKSLAFPTLLMIFAYWWFPEREDRRRLLEALSIAVAVSAAFGFVDFFMPFTESGALGRATGILENPNILAGVLSGFGLVSLHLGLDREFARIRRALHLGIYGLAMVTLVLTLSRACWLGAIVAHAVYLLYFNRRLLAAGILATALLATVALPLVPEIVRERVTSTFDPSQRRVVYHGGGAEKFGSGSERIIFYLIGMEMFAESPIWGHGLNSFYLNAPRYGAKYGLVANKSPHSIVVQLAAEYGLMGLSVFGWLGLSVVLISRSLWRRGGEERSTGALLMVVGVGMATTNLFHATALASHVVGGSFWLFLGLSARARQATVPVRAVTSRAAALLPDMRRTLPEIQPVRALRSTGIQPRRA